MRGTRVDLATVRNSMVGLVSPGHRGKVRWWRGSRRVPIIGIVVAASAALLAVPPAAAAAALPGATVRSAQTPFNSLATKSATAVCPAGTRVTGGSGRINGAGGKALITQLQPVHTSTGDSFVAAASEVESGFAGTWSVQAVAICANPLPGMTIVSNSVQRPAGDAAILSLTLARQCPATAPVAIGGGTKIDPNGQVLLRRLEQLPGPGGPSQISVNAVVDRTGNPAAWTMTTYAVCANIPATSTAVTRVATASDAITDPKIVEAACPPGMQVTGIGGAVQFGNPDVSLESLAPQVLPGGSPGSLARVIGREVIPTQENWRAQAIAMCAA